MFHTQGTVWCGFFHYASEQIIRIRVFLPRTSNPAFLLISTRWALNTQEHTRFPGFLGWVGNRPSGALSAPARPLHLLRRHISALSSLWEPGAAVTKASYTWQLKTAAGFLAQS